MDSCLTSPALFQVYLSLTFQLSQTAVAKVEMSSTFPTVPVKLSNSQPYLFNSDLQYNLRQSWRHAFNGYCDHCSWKKLNSWLQCRSSLRCCNQSVHVYQNCLEQSQKRVCNGAYDHYNYMETRLYQVILVGTLTGVQRNIRCIVLAALSTTK